MQTMNCRAVGIAGRDLAGGIELLKEIQERQELNWLSMNLVDDNSRQPLFSPSVNIQVGSLTIAVLGLTDERVGKKDEGYSILPWSEVLPEAVATAEAGADMVILLSSYPDRENKEIARTIQGIDLILQSGHASSNLPPQREGETLLTRVGSRGKYLGLMRINWTGAKKWAQNFSDQIVAEQNRLDRIKWQIGRMEKRAPQAELKKNDRYRQLLTSKEQSEENILQLS